MNDRGIYRSAYEALADDDDFQSLSPLAQAVFHTLRLKLGQYGIAVFYVSVLGEYHRKASPEQLTDAVVELEAPKPGRAHGWIRRERNLVWIVNGLRFEPSLSLENANHRKGALRYARTLPACALVDAFVAHYHLAESHPDPIPTPSGTRTNGIGRGWGITEQEQEREREPEPKSETETEGTAATAVPDFARDVADALPSDDDRSNLVTFLSRCASEASAKSWAANFRASLDAMPGHTPVTAAQLARAIGDHVRNGAAVNSNLFRTYLKAALTVENGAGSSAPAPAGDDAGTILATIRGLIVENYTPAAGTTRFIRKDDVRKLGPEVFRAYEAIGGAARVINTKPEMLGLLVRDFAQALAGARRAS